MAATTSALVLLMLVCQVLASAPSVINIVTIARGPRFGNTSIISWTPSGASHSTCGRATFASDTNLEAADWRECAALYSAWTASRGTFRVVKVRGKPYVALVHEADCTLAVRPLNAAKGPYTIGNEDVEALLRRSLRDYSRGTLLAVKGTMECDVAAGGRARLGWQISKSAPE